MDENVDKYIAAFNEKSEYLLHRPFDIEFTEAYMEDFLYYVFERENDGFPFEETMSKEYQSWCRKKKEWNMRLMEWKKAHPNEPGGFDEKINYDDVPCFRYNPIAIEFYKNNKGESRARHSIILKDNPESYEFLDGRKFVIMSPITYVGRNRSADNGRYLYALAFDLDGVGMEELEHLMKLMMVRTLKSGEVVHSLPMANIIVNSGHGLHLYYLLKEPIPLYKRNREVLNKLKRGLTQMIWNKLTSTIDQVQHQGIFQGFRIPGTQTKFGKIVRAFYNSDSDYHTVESLNSHILSYNENKLSKEDIATLNDSKYNPNGVTLKEAERRWPEWYERVVIDGIKTPKKWHIKRDLYDWWLKRLWESDQIVAGHRYFCLMSLAVYAVKCDIGYEELKKDAMKLVARMEELTIHDDNHFTEKDAMDALQAFKVGYCTFPRNSIEYLTGLEMLVNRRNGRPQAAHLKRARAVQMVDDPEGEWRNKKGRLDNTLGTNASAWKIAHWRAWNLDGTKMQCHRETGIGRCTIDRWWRGLDLLMDISPYTRIGNNRLMGWNLGNGTILYENITEANIKEMFQTYLGNVGPDKGKKK